MYSRIAGWTLPRQLNDVVKRSALLLTLARRVRRGLELFATACGYAWYPLSRLFGLPYFGPYLSANQTDPVRKPAMRRLAAAEHALKGPLDILEIGAWAGESTLLWSRYGTVTTIDTWKDSEAAHEPMKRATVNDAIFRLFRHNLRRRPNVTFIRGNSQVVLVDLIARGARFDLVYLDGDHAYPAFVADLRHALQLTKPGGIVCGDDGKGPPAGSDVDLAEARAHADRDTWREIHFGVYFGLLDVFGSYDHEYGFWHVRV